MSEKTESPLFETKKTTQKDYFRILSLDGGGICSLRTLIFLKHLEEKLGKPLSKVFDLIAGTSSGGLIALGLSLAKPNTQDPAFSAHDLIHFYKNYGPEIFRKPELPAILRNNRLFKIFRIFEKLFFAKYIHQGAQNVFQSLFGSSYLSELLTQVLILACEIKDDSLHPFLFSSSQSQQDRKQDFLNYQVALGTSAAPIFFPPYILNTSSETKHHLADGALIAHDPALLAYFHAQKLCSMDRPILIVSMGTATGGHSRHWKCSRLKYGSGILKWLFSIKELIDLHQNLPRLQLEKALRPTDLYLRLAPPPIFFPIDDCSMAHFTHLFDTAHLYLEKKGKFFDDLIDILS